MPRGSKRVKAKDKAEDDDVVDYEEKRRRNIARNRAKLAELGLLDDVQSIVNAEVASRAASSDAKRKRRQALRKKRNSAQPAPRRQSKRQRGQASDNMQLSADFKSIPQSGKSRRPNWNVMTEKQTFDESGEGEEGEELGDGRLHGMDNAGEAVSLDADETRHLTSISFTNVGEANSYPTGGLRSPYFGTEEASDSKKKRKKREGNVASGGKDADARRRDECECGLRSVECGVWSVRERGVVGERRHGVIARY